MIYSKSASTRIEGEKYMSILKVDNLCKRFGKKEVLKDVSFEVNLLVLMELVKLRQLSVY